MPFLGSMFIGYLFLRTFCLRDPFVDVFVFVFRVSICLVFFVLVPFWGPFLVCILLMRYIQPLVLRCEKITFRLCTSRQEATAKPHFGESTSSLCRPFTSWRSEIPSFRWKFWEPEALDLWLMFLKGARAQTVAHNADG